MEEDQQNQNKNEKPRYYATDFNEIKENLSDEEKLLFERYIIRKTKCFRILERNAIILKTKRNFSRLYPTLQKIKKNRPASPERNTFEGS